MSLIQEALRRKDDDAIHPDTAMPPRVIPQMREGPSAPREAPAAREVPPVIKIPARRSSKPSSKSKSWVPVVVALLVVLALLGGAFAVFVYSMRRMADTAEALPPAGPSVAPVETASVTPRPVPAPSPAPRSEPAPAPRVAVEVERPATPARSPAVAKPVVPESAAVAARAPQPAPAPRVESPRPARPKPPPVVTAPPKKNLEGVKTVSAAVSASSSWPRLTLHGVMAQTSPSQGSAMINGTVVEVGEKIEECRLLEVHRNGVLLEFKGETQFVRVGQSTF